MEPGPTCLGRSCFLAMKFNPYNALTLTTNEISVDEAYLSQDIHWTPPVNLLEPDWSITPVNDYAQVRKLYLDIETEGLDPKQHRIIMIGVMIDGDYSSTPEVTRLKLEKGHIFEASEPDNDDAERRILSQFLKAMRGLNPEIVSMHNGVDFDLPFIATRLKVLGMPCPIYRSPDSKFMSAASLNGRGIGYNPVYFTRPNDRGYVYNDGSFPQVVDTLHLAGQVDKIRADMHAYTLKYLAHYAGGRDEKRLELTYREMMECWRTRDTQKLRDYLIYDLEDQKIVSDFFIPAIWYQQMLIPMPVQELSVASPARKWNTLLQKFYKPLVGEQFKGFRGYYQLPEADIKRSYGGGATGCNPGMYRYFFKIDVSSLYPSLITRYGLTDLRKDPMRLAEKALATFKELRYIFKGAANGKGERIKDSYLFPQVAQMFDGVDLNNMSEGERKNYKTVDGSLKVCINGYYGFLGVGGYPFNSQRSAALVTAYGRVLMDKMIEVAERYCNVINIDTDGLCLQPKLVDEVGSQPPIKHPKTGELIEFNGGSYKHPITKELVKAPKNYINPEFVWAHVQAILPDEIEIELEESHPEGAMFAPKMKNYVYWSCKELAPQTKGLFRKRNRSKLQKQFPIKFCHLWAYESLEAAEAYYQSVLERLEAKPLEDLLAEVTFTQRIPINNKTLVQANLGLPGDKVSFYWASQQTFTPKGNARKKLDRFPIRVVENDDGSLRVSLQNIPTEYVFQELNSDWYKADINKIREGLVNV